MSEAEVDITTRLWTALGKHYPHWEVNSMGIAGRGLEALIFEVQSNRHGALAIRVPFMRIAKNPNDPEVNYRHVLQKEAAIYELLNQKQFGAAPRYFGLVSDNHIDFLATRFVSHDDSTPNSYSLGQILRQLHDIDLPETMPYILIGNDFAEHICRRLDQRMSFIRNWSDKVLPLPDRSDVLRALAPVSSRRSLLHMDLRPENVLTCRGAIRSLIDWSNSAIGHPAVEFARLREYGLLNDQVLKGYACNPLAQVKKATELILRLDAGYARNCIFVRITKCYGSKEKTSTYRNVTTNIGEGYLKMSRASLSRFFIIRIQ